MSDWLKQKASRLYQESILYSLLGGLRVGGKYFLFDMSGPLVHSPLGMFFYNQRTIFFGSGLLFLIVLFTLVLVLPSTREMWLTVFVLLGFWLLGIVATYILNRAVEKKVQSWIESSTHSESPPILDKYFILDFLLVLCLIAFGKLLKLPLEEFAFLLFANTVVWSAYIGGGRRYNQLFLLALILVPVVSALFFLGTRLEITEPYWFFLVLYLGPLIGMSLVTVFSVLMIAMLRSTEHQITQEHLQLLGKYETMLSTATVKIDEAAKSTNQELFSERQFDKQANKVLKDLCSLEGPFWYARACLWFLEDHQDNGEVALPGPRFKFNLAEKYKYGIDPRAAFVNFSELKLMHPVRHRAETLDEATLEFRPAKNAPAAVIPLRHHGVKRAVLSLYGTSSSPPLPRQEAAFLRSFGSIISNAMEQWASRYKMFPQREMDDLFQCETLETVFPLAARILRRYLMAAGCMVIFRRDPSKKEMEIVAKEGFSDDIFNNKYEAGRGQTGLCAELGELVRWDDLEKNQLEFDPIYLKNLIKSHGHPITSWMAIPIGPCGFNYGVIKVVNSQFRANWFTDYDGQLGKDLALRLRVIIEKFLQIKETEEASAESKRQAQRAQEYAHDALTLKQKSEEAARQRQQDLLTITHQLQGPLIPVIGTLSGITQSSVPPSIKEKLEHVQALVDDAFTLCYGTFTTFALEAEQKPAAIAETIDAPAEMRKLCERLRRTNSRQDLGFIFREVPEFPSLRMDKNIFTTVLYSLIHNAMKYSAESSDVTLECGFEGPPRKPVLKVRSNGEPIHPNERNEIFQKFGRGRAVERGRHHSGVGLGLWVARELMRYIGGDLTVELSPYDPTLSVFIVHLPRSS